MAGPRPISTICQKTLTVRRLDQIGERLSLLEVVIREIATGPGTLQKYGSQPTSIQPIRARLPDLNRVTKQASMAMI